MNGVVSLPISSDLLDVRLVDLDAVSLLAQWKPPGLCCRPVQISCASGSSPLASTDLMEKCPDAVIDIMRAHPMVILGGILQRNPFFVPPEQFVSDFRKRRTMQTARAAGV